MWLCLCAVGVASAGTVTPVAGGFSLNHAGAVDSGVISVLGTFVTTKTSAAPTMRFPMFDPSVGRLTGVAVSVNTTASTFTIAPSGVLSLVSFATASRSLNYTISAGTVAASDGATRLDSGAVLLTLLGLGSADIGGAQLAKTTTFATPSDVANFVGAGNVAVDVGASDTLGVSTLVSLLNGAGFGGSGQYAGVVSLTYTYAAYPTGGQLAIDKTASVASARRGDSITYTLLFTNNGVTPIDSLTIADATPPYTTYQSSGTSTVPAGVAVSAATVPAIGSAGALAWRFSGRLAAFASGVVRYTVVVD